MFLEMRTYVLKPGMTNNFVERFAEGLTARLQFSKLLGLWQSEVGGLNRVVHVWPYESSERSSSSPPLPEGKLGNLYEFRTYTYQPGTMPAVLERFGKVIPARTKISPLVFAGQTIIGPLNRYVHVWVYKEAGERERVRARATP